MSIVGLMPGELWWRYWKTKEGVLHLVSARCLYVDKNGWVTWASPSNPDDHTWKERGKSLDWWEPSVRCAFRRYIFDYLLYEDDLALEQMDIIHTAVEMFIYQRETGCMAVKESDCHAGV